jgi:signal transduction histidine kinase
MEDFIKNQKTLFNKLNNKIIDLERQINNRDEFLAHAVHELKSAVHNIYFMSDYLNNYWVNIIPSRQQEHIILIKELANHLKVLSEELLDFSLISSETSTQNFNHINFTELINDTIEYCQKAFSQFQNLEIVFNTNDINEAIINGNSHRIRQVITNLLVNAIKYGDGGLISISLELTNRSKISYWQLSVNDQGIGLSENEIESIFKPFFRSVKSKLIPGHGIGLAICQKIADNHDSLLKAVNNKNKGSTFYFSVPAVLMD